MSYQVKLPLATSRKTSKKKDELRGYSLEPPTINADPVCQKQLFISKASGHMTSFLKKYAPTTESPVPLGPSSLAQHSTIVYPLLQIGPLRITQEHMITTQILAHHLQNPAVSAYLTSGYFNLTREYQRLILHSKCLVSLLAASPQVTPFSYPKVAQANNIPRLTGSSRHEISHRISRKRTRTLSNSSWRTHAKRVSRM
jgi:hypothetical protein